MFIAIESQGTMKVTQEVIYKRRLCVEYLWNSKKQLKFHIKILFTFY